MKRVMSGAERFSLFERKRNGLLSPTALLGQHGFAWLLNLPSIILIVAIVVYPIGYSFWISLHKYNLRRPDAFEFVGFANFATAIKSDEFWQALLITVEFTAISVVLILVVATCIALVANQKFLGRGLLRALILVPWAIPPVVNGLMWKWIFNSQLGALNGILYQFGLIDTYQSYFLTHFSAISALAFAHVWKQVPFAAIIILASLQAIPSELYDAAKVDRAGLVRRFTHVTVPWLLHAYLIIMILETMTAFRVFDIIFVMTGGGPGDMTTVLAWLAFQTSFVSLNFGLGNTYAYYIAAFTLGLAIVYIKAIYARGEIKQ